MYEYKMGTRDYKVECDGVTQKELLHILLLNPARVMATTKPRWIDIIVDIDYIVLVPIVLGLEFMRIIMIL